MLQWGSSSPISLAVTIRGAILVKIKNVIPENASFKGYFTVIYVVITIGQAPSFGVPYKDSFDGVTFPRCGNPSDDE